MALTRITQGVIKPNENYDTHNINSTGIVTATGLNISGNASIGGVLTYEDVTNIDAIGIITARSGVDVDDFLSVGSNIHLGNAGIVTATKFIATGDNSYLKYLQVDSMEINSGIPRISLNDTNQENDYDIRVNNGQFQIYDQDTSDSTKERFIVESNGTVNITKGPFTVGTGATITTAGAGFFAGIVTATSFSGDGSALTGLASDKIFEGNTKAEVSDSGSDGKFFVETEGTERFSIDSTGDFAFNNCNDSFFNAGGNLTIDYKTYNSIRLRQQITSSAANMILFNVPFTIWNNNDAATTIDFHRGDRIQVGSGVSIGVSGNIVATGIVTATGIDLNGDLDVDGHTNLDNLSVAGVSTFTGEIHGDGQRLGSLSGGGRFSGLFVNDGTSYYGSNKLFVANGNGFGLDAYGGNDSWLKANTGGGTAGDCWMKTGSSSGGYVYAKGADGVELHHAGTSDKKLETVSGGVNVVGSLTVNGAALQSGITGIDTTGTSHFNHLSVTGIATFSGTEAIFNRVSFPQSGNKTIVGNMAGGSGPTGTEITVVGYGAGYASSGDKLTAIGRMSGKTVSGSDNTCIGYESGYSNQGAQKNVFVGKEAGYGNKTGSQNIVVGSDAGEGVWNNANYSNSVILGCEAGAILTSSNSNVIVIGYDAEPSSNSVTNEITLGNSSITNLRVPGIGVTFATSGNHITGITTFKDRIKLGNSGNGELYYSGGIKMVSTAQIELESANQMYLKAQSSGLFLFASNQEVVSVYGGSGGGVYFRHNNTQKLKLESGNWTYQGSATVTFDNHLYASSDSAIDIGTNSVRFRNIYADTLYGDGSNLTGISGGGGGVTSDSEENTVGGSDAGLNLDSDTYRNTLFGYQAGEQINSGDDNTCIGWKAADKLTNGSKNVAVGSEALENNSSGSDNVAIGWEAGRSLTSGQGNTMIGNMAGRSMSGNDNIAIGDHAYSNGGGTRTIGIGGESVWLGGTDVIGIGKYTMARGGSQVGGIGIGYYAGRNNSGDHNIYLGYEAGYGSGSSPYSTGNYNISQGYKSLYAINTGYDNVAIGASAGEGVNDGYDNVLIGVNAGLGVTTGHKNVYIGKSAGKHTHQSRQVAIGHEALMYSGNTTAGYRGNQHTAIGYQCMMNLGIYVNYNTAVGEGAMRSATSGFNAAFGQNALASGGGEINTAIGMNSLDVCNGSWNSALGYKSGDDCTSGSKNSLIGVYAGEDIVGGSHNLCLGAYSTVSASGVSNEAVIGAPAGHASVINHVRMPGIGVSFSAGGAVISGIVTAASFVGDGSALTGVGGGVTSDAQYNTKGGSNSGDAFSGTSAEKNTLFGYDTGTEINSGDDNTCIGYRSGESITSGGSNTLVGSITGERITTTGSNTALGYYCLAETTGSSNTAVGAWALKDSGNCTGNSALGMWALYANNSGNYNVAMGMNAAYGVWSSPRDYIIGIGYEALKWSKGDHNIGIGYRAGYAGDSSAYNEGSHNITIGHYSGKQLSTGSDNTIIGPDAGDALASGSNNLILGHDAAASSNSVSNEITLGDSNITKFRIPGVSASISATESVLPAANFNAGVLQEVYMNDTGGGIQSNYNHDVLTYGMVWNGVTNAAGSWTFNVRGDGSTTFDSLTTTNRVTTMTMYSANNSTSNYMTAFKIDGTTQTVKWAGGSAPSAATGSGVDVYSMTIMKTAANTYHVFGNVTNFA